MSNNRQSKIEIGTQDSINSIDELKNRVEPTKVIQEEDFKPASEDSGVEFATDDEKVKLMIARMVQKQVEEELSKQSNKAALDAGNKLIDIGTIQDINFLEYIKNKAPKVTLVVPIRKNSDGSFNEYKRPLIYKDGNYARDIKTGSLLWEMYIPVSINGWDLHEIGRCWTSLGVYGSPAPHAVLKNIPLPIAQIIAEQRQVTFPIPGEFDEEGNPKIFEPCSLRATTTPMKDCTNVSLGELIGNNFYQG